MDLAAGAFRAVFALLVTLGLIGLAAVAMRRFGPDALARFQRLEGKACRVGASVLGNHRHTGALAPHLELLDGSGAERVARRQHDLAALALVKVGELGDGRGLAAAVDADHQYDVRLACDVDDKRRGDRLQLGRHTNQVTSSAEITTKRREVSRILTVLRARELDLETQGGKKSARTAE